MTFDALLLDAGPLDAIVYAAKNPDIRAWFRAHLQAGTQFVLPEIADYEVRRLLLKRRATARLQDLDGYAETLLYHPITTSVMRRAAEVWAEGRRMGRPMAADDRLDGDAILCGHERELAAEGVRLITITRDVGDLAPFVREARRWDEVQP